jgi:hypothetical protein
MVERHAPSSTSWGSLVRAQYRPSRNAVRSHIRRRRAWVGGRDAPSSTARGPVLSMIQLHSRGPSMTDLEHSAGDLAQAIEISRRVIRGIEPFHDFHRYHQKAITEAHDGREAEAMVALGTAVELLLRRAVQWASRARDEDSHAEARRLSSVFRNLSPTRVPSSQVSSRVRLVPRPKHRRRAGCAVSVARPQRDVVADSRRAPPTLSTSSNKVFVWSQQRQAPSRS